VQDIVEQKLSAIKCESGKVAEQWNNINECVSNTIRDLVGKVDRRERKPWITQEMKIKWMNKTL
jgi:hypothetical protein